MSNKLAKTTTAAMDAKILKLDEALVEFTGEPIKGADGKELVLRVVLLNYLGTMKTESGQEAIRAFSLGADISKADGEYVPKAADLVLLRSAVEANAIGYGPVIRGQALLLLQD